jgi:GntR family transcriptional regulator / MocR family aminotransferase
MSTSSPELLVRLNRSRPRSLRAQLESSLRNAIRTGRLRPGSRLPSSRALAADLQITRGVVVAAYDQLTAEGYLTARQGWGTVVNDTTTPATPDRRPAPAAVARYDFRPGAPDVGPFPRAAWLRATRAAVRALPYLDLGYGDPGGLVCLRETLAGYLGRVRGVSGPVQHGTAGPSDRRADGTAGSHPRAEARPGPGEARSGASTTSHIPR